MSIQHYSIGTYDKPKVISQAVHSPIRLCILKTANDIQILTGCGGDTLILFALFRRSVKGTALSLI